MDRSSKTAELVGDRVTWIDLSETGCLDSIRVFDKVEREQPVQPDYSPVEVEAQPSCLSQVRYQPQIALLSTESPSVAASEG